MDTKAMQRKIMRRVYYSYGISIATHSMMWRGIFLGVAAVLLADWLHVASIVQNFLAVPVGSAPYFVMEAFTNAVSSGELLTVLMIVAAGIIALNSGWKILSRLTPHFNFVRLA